MDPELAEALSAARCPRPFDILGLHPAGDEGGWVVRAWLPWATDPRVARVGHADVVMEAVSVILQVGSFKLRKKRIFKMAPIHHHFEIKGIAETKVVIRFW